MSRWFSSYGFAEVHPDVIVGAYPLDAEDVQTLGLMSVDRVLNLVEDTEYEPGARRVVEASLRAHEIEETRLSLVDYGHLPLAELDAAIATVVGWVGERRRVYLHCRAGWQRSAAVAAGAVAIVEDVDIEQALELVRARKPSADPLPHQRDDLIAWWSARPAGRRRRRVG